jgi:hypothetical protein
MRLGHVHSPDIKAHRPRDAATSTSSMGDT